MKSSKFRLLLLKRNQKYKIDKFELNTYQCSELKRICDTPKLSQLAESKLFALFVKAKYRIELIQSSVGCFFVWKLKVIFLWFGAGEKAQCLHALPL